MARRDGTEVRPYERNLWMISMGVPDQVVKDVRDAAAFACAELAEDQVVFRQRDGHDSRRYSQASAPRCARFVVRFDAERYLKNYRSRCVIAGTMP